MKRGTFIQLSTTGAIAVVFPSLLNACREPVKYPDSLSNPAQLRNILNSKTLHKVGNDYLEKAPNEASKRTLVEHLTTDASSDTTLVPQLMEQQIKRDFNTGNTVMINGWLLSITEARQCALLALEQTN